MTAKWAATNTLRGYLPNDEMTAMGREARAALALVETALDAADKFCQRLDAPEYLREALRAVREGK